MILIVCRLIDIIDSIFKATKSPINNVSILGFVLRAFRIEKGFSQEKLAEIALLHRTYIGSVERGERNPSFKSLNRILCALEVSWSEFGNCLDIELMRNS